MASINCSLCHKNVLITLNIDCSIMESYLEENGVNYFDSMKLGFSFDYGVVSVRKL